MKLLRRKSQINTFPLSLETMASKEPISKTETTAGSEIPLSDEYEASVPLSTPMPSTLAGKLHKVVN